MSKQVLYHVVSHYITYYVLDLASTECTTDYYLAIDLEKRGYLTVNSIEKSLKEAKLPTNPSDILFLEECLELSSKDDIISFWRIQPYLIPDEVKFTKANLQACFNWLYKSAKQNPNNHVEKEESPIKKSDVEDADSQAE